MAINEKVPGKSRPAAATAPISTRSNIADQNVEIAAEPVAFVPAAIEQSAAEPVEVKALVASAPASNASPVVKSSGKPGDEFNACDLSLKTLDLISENTVAILDYAAALGKAESVSDAIDLQSRFASQRYSTLIRQTTEIAELTRRFAFGLSAPVRLSFSAFKG